MTIDDIYITSYDELKEAVQELGFLPLFPCAVPGFSIEENVDPSLWYSADGDWKIWDWKGPIINDLQCAYGKFFEKKSTYVSRDVFLDLANYRRDGYDLDARYDDGLAKFQDKQLYGLIETHAPVLSKELRVSGGYAYSGRWQKTEGKKGFDTTITRLQEQCYVIISDFVYTLDKHGNRRGWGVAQYSTPEKFMGCSFSNAVYQRSPEESYARLLERLAVLFPYATEKQLKKFLK